MTFSLFGNAPMKRYSNVRYLFLSITRCLVMYNVNPSLTRGEPFNSSVMAAMIARLTIRKSRIRWRLGKNRFCTAIPENPFPESRGPMKPASA